MKYPKIDNSGVRTSGPCDVRVAIPISNSTEISNVFKYVVIIIILSLKKNFRQGGPIEIGRSTCIHFKKYESEVGVIM